MSISEFDESRRIISKLDSATSVGVSLEICEEAATAGNIGDPRPHRHAPVKTSVGSYATTIVIERRDLFRDCLVRCLRANKPNDVIRSYSSVDEWLNERPDPSSEAVVVLCYAERIEADVDHDVSQLLHFDADLPIIILSDREDAGSVLTALDKGARGYISTSMAWDVAVQAIRLVQAGGTFVPARTLIVSRDSIEKLPPASEKPQNGLFTARQLTVLESLRQGKANKIIAYELNMCESTVKVHVRNIMKKLHAKNRTEVAILMNGFERSQKGSSARANDASAK